MKFPRLYVLIVLQLLIVLAACTRATTAETEPKASRAVPQPTQQRLLPLISNAAVPTDGTLPAIPTPATPTTFFVAPNGQRNGDGSFDRPWDLATALRQPQSVKPGAVIWLRGGVYRGSFVSQLKGTSNAPIIVRQYPSERATLDHTSNTSSDSPLIVKGSWTWYWGFEVTNLATQRVTDFSGTYPKDLVRAMGINVRGPFNKFINLVVHDTGLSGIGFWTEAIDSEIYGSIIYNNGWQGPDRGHGHAIYGQNQTGTKRIIDNIAFNQFSHGLHIYASPDTTLSGFQIEGNMAFNNGTLSREGSAPNILVGGESFIAAEQITVTGNFTYQRATARNVRLDVFSSSKDITSSNNYFAGGTIVTSIGAWQQITMTGNTFVATGNQERNLVQFQPEGNPLMAHRWNQNVYIGEPSSTAFQLQRRALTFLDWQTATGFDLNSQYMSLPSGQQIFIRPNLYEQGRANIAVYNWQQLPTATVDVSQILQPGAHYEVHNVQNYFGEPVTSGIYDGTPLLLPMDAVPASLPVGSGWATPPVTGPEFNVFVLTTKESTAVDSK